MSDHHVELTSLFLAFSRRKLLDEFWPRMRRCVESLTEEQVWWRPNEASNSVGNLLLHLNGNARQWLVAPFTERDDTRNRPAEFRQRDGIAKSVLLRELEETMTEASRVLAELTPADLVAPYEIQGYKV